MITLEVNGKIANADVEQDTPLLWVLRDSLQLTGTKYGCGMGVCGSCTVLLDGEPVRSCVTLATAAVGRKIVTIEGAASGPVGKAVQQAWQKIDVAQCGYCQSGQIMSAIALLASNGRPGDDEIANAMNGNLCRCATYVRIRAAIHEAAGNLGPGGAA